MIHVDSAPHTVADGAWLAGVERWSPDPHRFQQIRSETVPIMASSAKAPYLRYTHLFDDEPAKSSAPINGLFSAKAENEGQNAEG
jgi:hypothetical protein